MSDPYCYICNTEGCVSAKHYEIERNIMAQILNGEGDPDNFLDKIKEFHAQTFLKKDSNEQR